VLVRSNFGAGGMNQYFKELRVPFRACVGVCIKYRILLTKGCLLKFTYRNPTPTVYIQVYILVCFMRTKFQLEELDKFTAADHIRTAV
jgi:hypothetical protein